jgi:RNA polymerase sigma-70 factor, ECF subfamily
VSNTEYDWLQQARAGSDDAFTQLVEVYQTRVFNLCFRMLGNAQEAEDAAQETFWRAYQALNRYDTSRPFVTWLLSIAAHYCIDQHRRKQLPSFAMELLPEESVPFISPGPEAVVVQTEEDRYLHSLLDRLNPKDRAALILRYWYDFSEVEIAQSLSLSVSAVKSRLHRSRLYLAQNWHSNHQPTLVFKEAA